MAKKVVEQKKWSFQGNLTDADYAKVGEVWEKQDIYSKTARKYWVAQLWIPRLFWYCVVVLSLGTLFFGYTTYHYFNKPDPVFLFEGVKGDLRCVDARDVSGKSILTSHQKKFCKDLERR